MRAMAMAERDWIRCRACDEPLAERWRDGSVKPIVPDSYIDPRGRLVITCPRPQCGRRRRIPPRFGRAA